MTNKHIMEAVNDYSRQLRLPAFRKHFQQIAKQAAAQHLSHEAYLLELLKVEMQERTERRKKQRLRRAA